MTLEGLRDLLKRGAMLVVPQDPSQALRALFYLQGEIRNAQPTGGEDHRVVAREAHFVEMEQARQLIRIATDGNPPPLLDPFAGGGRIPLAAQRLGLEAQASDLNPVAVIINKARIEIPPRFAGRPSVNPRDRAGLFATEAQSAHRPMGDSELDESRRGEAATRPRSSRQGIGGTDGGWKGAAGLAADVRYYGEWMRERGYDARELATQDAHAAGLADDDVALREAGRGARAYGEAVSVYLAFAVDKGTDYYFSVARWHNSGEKITATFGRQAISMIRDYAEANSFSQSTGNWNSHINWIWKVLESLPIDCIGLAEQNGAAQLARSAITLSTSPPYYDNIGYAHLSDYFYVWMRPMLRSIYPDILGSMLAPKAQELIAEAARHPSKDDVKAFFEAGMLGTFATIRRFVTKAYPLTVYYAFNQQDAGFMTPHPRPPPPQGGRGRQV